MTWTLYRWTWRVKSPLYISMPPAGVLTRCRLYVPAYPLWGAVTNELGKQEIVLPSENKFSSKDVRNYYEKIGNYLKENTRLSYLYPAEQVHGTWQAWLPRYQEGQGLCWSREDQADNEPPTIHRAFRSRLLYTRLSTAIERTSRTAADETLHETECLQAFWRNEKKSEVKPVAMVGYVFIKTHESENLLEKLRKINRLFVGADTRYGLGQLDCEEYLKPQSPFFNLTVELNNPIQVVVKDCSYVLGHTKNHHPLRGELELIGRWDREKMKVNNECYWTPGSHLNKKKEFELDKIGCWKHLP